MLSYFNDRIITPEMMRAMIILYLGPHNRPDFSTDYLLSPILAPEALLAEFPKVCLLTGERDPLVDDTVIFAGRIRQAKYQAFISRRELGLERDSTRFSERDHVEVALLPGVSHGFFQFVSVYPDGWKHIIRCARWMEDMLNATASNGTMTPRSPATAKRIGTPTRGGRHHVRRPTESSADEDQPLMMTPMGEGANSERRANGDGRKGKKGKTRRTSTPRSGIAARSKSSVSLASEDDILQRRIQGLTTSLMREEDDDDLQGVFLGE
jgi:alpha/beta hydrolase fold